MQSHPTTIPEPASTHLTRQKTSGLSIVSYCRKNNINPTTFYGWNKRYKKTLLAVAPADPTKLPFIEIPIKTPLHSDNKSPVRITHTEITIPQTAFVPVCEAFNDYLKALLCTKRTSK